VYGVFAVRFSPIAKSQPLTAIKDKRLLDITWYGLSCFRVTERGQITVVTDPYAEGIGLPMPKLKGDVVTVSHDSPGHNNIEAVKGAQYVVAGAGEYEIGGVFFTGVAMHNPENEAARPNIAVLIEYDNLRVLHMGDLSHVPNQSDVEDFGEVNVLLLPVGGGGGLKSTLAADVVALIEPHYVVPMHYALPGLAVELEPVDHFLKTMGVSNPQEEEMLRVTVSGLPEQPQVVMLTPQLQ
jgi:L-ascorbate metabolism protein UlaG (beta-lactamase superfamily)